MSTEARVHAAVVERVRDAYGLEVREIVVLGRAPDRSTLHLRTAAGDRVLKLYRGSRVELVEGYVQALRTAEAHAIPAPRLLDTADGRSWITVDGGRALLLTHLQGEHVDADPDTMRDLGALAARVHLIPGEGPAAAWSVAHLRDEIRRGAEDPALGRLAGWERIPDVVGAVERLPAMEDLPQGLVHTDLWPGNAVRTPDGEIALLDWDDAGRGTVVLDIGYVLQATCVADDPPGWREDLARAFLDAYRAVRPLTGTETEAIGDAMSFGALYYVLMHEQRTISLDLWARARFIDDHRDQIVASLRP